MNYYINTPSLRLFEFTSVEYIKVERITYGTLLLFIDFVSDKIQIKIKYFFLSVRSM